jgi:hypothetical protein
LGNCAPPLGWELEADRPLGLPVAAEASAADRLAATELAPALYSHPVTLALAEPARMTVLDADECEDLQSAEAAAADVDDARAEIQTGYAENVASIGSRVFLFFRSLDEQVFLRGRQIERAAAESLERSGRRKGRQIELVQVGAADLDGGVSDRG